MKGISYITDDKNRNKAVVINLKDIDKHEEEIHEFIDVLIAESRKDDELISWEEATKAIKAKRQAMNYFCESLKIISNARLY